MHPLAANSRSSSSTRRRRRTAGGAPAPRGADARALRVKEPSFSLDVARLVNLCCGAMSDDRADPPPAPGAEAPAGGAAPPKDELVIIAEPCRSDAASATELARVEDQLEAADERARTLAEEVRGDGGGPRAPARLSHRAVRCLPRGREPAALRRASLLVRVRSRRRGAAPRRSPSCARSSRRASAARASASASSWRRCSSW